MQLTRSLEGVTYFDGPTNRSRVIWEDNGFLHPYRFNRSSSGNSMLISFRSGWRLPRTYGFFFRIYCNPPAQGSSRSYNTKPDFCLSKSIVKSKFSSRNPSMKFGKDHTLNNSDLEMKSKQRKSGRNGKLDNKKYPYEYRYVRNSTIIFLYHYSPYFLIVKASLRDQTFHLTLILEKCNTSTSIQSL